MGFILGKNIKTLHMQYGYLTSVNEVIPFYEIRDCSIMGYGFLDTIPKFPFKKGQNYYISWLTLSSILLSKTKQH